MKSNPATTGCLAILLLIAASPVVSSLRADEETVDRRELSRWVMTYYQNPTPENFVERVTDMSRAGLLYDPKPNARPDASIMFLGKVMAANPAKIADWMDALASLPEKDVQALKRAVWYSGTDEGNAWLVEHGEAELANGPRPLLLANTPAMQLQPHHLDQLWEWFFATGDKEPIARIASLFSLAHEMPNEQSMDLISPPKKTDDPTRRQIERYNYGLLKPAMWSTTSLAVQHDRVLEILQELEQDHDHPRIKAWLGQIIRIAQTQRENRRDSP